MRVIRVFPRRTSLTPDDELAFVGDPPLFRPRADAVHISVTFTWDLDEGLRLLREWSQYYDRVLLGGPALPNGSKPEAFTPGQHLKNGCVITTRGCPNHCGFCLVPQREGMLRELPITNGWNVLDNNLLAASRAHVENVLNMLASQKERARFAGGLEAQRVQPWFAKALKDIRTHSAFLAYDRPNDRKHVAIAAKILLPCFWKRRLGCYVLCGFPGDTIDNANERCQYVGDLGMLPFPMFLRKPGDREQIPPQWKKLVRCYARGIPKNNPPRKIMEIT